MAKAPATTILLGGSTNVISASHFAADLDKSNFFCPLSVMYMAILMLKYKKSIKNTKTASVDAILYYIFSCFLIEFYNRKLNENRVVTCWIIPN